MILSLEEEEIKEANNQMLINLIIHSMNKETWIRILGILRDFELLLCNIGRVRGVSIRMEKLLIYLGHTKETQDDWFENMFDYENE